MTEQIHPAVAFLVAAHERAEETARAYAEAFREDSAGVNGWTIAGKALGRFVALCGPDTVLRRVAAERKTLVDHQPGYTEYVNADGDSRDSVDCSTCDNGGVPWTWPCRTVLNLAEAWGWQPDAPATTLDGT